MGPHPVLRHFLERMGLRGILRDVLGTGLQRGLDHAETLSILVHNVLTSRGALYRVAQWAGGIDPGALGLTAGQLSRLNDDRLARSLDSLGSTRGRTVFFRLALAVIKDFELSLERVHYDTTTVTVFGQYETSKAEPKITYGHSKAHRPDLKQLLFGLNVTADGAVPLLHGVHSGNRTDDSVHVQNVDQLREIIARDDFVYVADSKLCTKGNLEHIAAYGGSFVTVLPRTRKEDQGFRDDLRAGRVKARWRRVLTRPSRREEDGPNTYACTAQGPALTQEGYRIVWVRSSQKERRDAESRQGRLRQAEVELAVLARRLGRGKLRSVKAVRARARALVEHFGVAAFLRVEVASHDVTAERYLRRGRPKAGDPKKTIHTRRLGLRVTRERAALRAEERADGVFPLVTNHPKASKREVIEMYKFQGHLEKRFALTKSEYGVAPVFLKKPHRVASLLHLYFIAIMCSALIEREVRTAMKARGIETLPILPEGRPTHTPTTPRILEAFADVAWHEFREGDRVVGFPVNLTPTQETLLDLLGLPRTAYA
jgi:transposase